MSISFSGSTLTFSDSTTMTTAAVAGPPGPTGPAGSPSSVSGPTGSPGPTGPAGSSGVNLISTQVICGASSMSFTGLSGYCKYRLIWSNVSTSTGYCNRLQLNNITGTCGSNYSSGPVYIASGNSYYPNNLRTYNQIYCTGWAFTCLVNLRASAGGCPGGKSAGQACFYNFTNGKPTIAYVNQFNYVPSGTPLFNTTYAREAIQAHWLFYETSTKTSIRYIPNQGVIYGTFSLYGVS
jgi:hypothetical protein